MCSNTGKEDKVYDILPDKAGDRSAMTRPRSEMKRRLNLKKVADVTQHKRGNTSKGNSESAIEWQQMNQIKSLYYQMKGNEGGNQIG